MRSFRAVGFGLGLASAGGTKVPPADAGFVAKWTQTHYAARLKTRR